MSSTGNASAAASDSASRKKIIRDSLRSFPDFPKPGIKFIDILPLFYKPAVLDALLCEIAQMLKGVGKIDAIACIEARGFLFGPPVARHLGVPLVCVRKAGKLPGSVLKSTYSKEYGSDSVEVQADALQPGWNVVLLDDLIATGGTVAATVKLINSAGATCKDALFLAQIEGLTGCELVKNLGLNVHLVV